ncbi:hypothetical protein RhiirA5_486343 [Rhizophagus irregularis]|uniref:Uncharacterized protein n=1 Tax=Rhizophagus irregularis TaxID=588596 RepID=A0A2N0NEM1_9GLOM|nr:hypothetical protein RhiirA5_486343 [Rhizophagus irregularis]
MCLTQQSERTYKRRDCKNGHKFGTSCLILGNQKSYGRQDYASGSSTRHFVPHLAIKKIIKRGIAHLGHQLSTSCLILGNQKGHERWDCASGLPIQHFMPQPGNQKVSEWIAKHLRQINGLQIQHFVCASSDNQEMAKQLCEGVPAPEQYHVTMAQ